MTLEKKCDDEKKVEVKEKFSQGLSFFSFKAKNVSEIIPENMTYFILNISTASV